MVEEIEFQPLNDHVDYRIVDNVLELRMPLVERGESSSGKTKTIVKCHEKIPGTDYIIGLNVNTPGKK